LQSQSLWQSFKPLNCILQAQPLTLSAGVTSLENVYPVLEQMALHGVPLLVHGEVTHADIDIFDREKVFIDTILAYH
jgi:dihydroorotase